MLNARNMPEKITREAFWKNVSPEKSPSDALTSDSMK
jgi:hypothetical protein